MAEGARAAFPLGVSPSSLLPPHPRKGKPVVRPGRKAKGPHIAERLVAEWKTADGEARCGEIPRRTKTMRGERSSRGVETTPGAGQAVVDRVAAERRMTFRIVRLF